MNTEHSIVRFNLLTSLLSILNHENENNTSFLLAKYFLENFHRLSKLSIYKVSQECYVSRSSIQRFVKQIGYDSFKSLKNSVNEIYQHQESFISYTDYAGFQNYMQLSLNEMIVDINHIFRDSKISQLIHDIHDARKVILLTAEDSSSSILTYQQGMLACGKLIRVITSASSSHTILEQLTDEDLLIVCSATGNYALAINQEISQLSTRKALITLNRTSILEDTYQKIYYFSTKYTFTNRKISSLRNIYTSYGMTYFFDLLYHEYFKTYTSEIAK